MLDRRFALEKSWTDVGKLRITAEHIIRKISGRHGSAIIGGFLTCTSSLCFASMVIGMIRFTALAQRLASSFPLQLQDRLHYHLVGDFV